MKKKDRSRPQRDVQRTELYDRAIAFLLALLAFLIPLKFGLPNLDTASPIIPADLSTLGRTITGFLQALFSLKARAAMKILADALSSPWPEEIAQILIVLVFFLWGMKALSRRDFLLRAGKTDAVMWLFCLTGLVATPLSPAPHSSLVILKQFVSCALLYFVVIHALETPAQQRRIVKCFLISTSIVALLGLYQFAVGFEQTARAVKQQIAPELQDAYLARIYRRRVFSVFVYPNSFAGFLLVVFPLTLFYLALHKEWFRKKNLHKLLGYIALLPLPCFLSFVLTQSKAGFLTFLLVAAASVVAARKKLGLKPKVLLAMFVAIVLILSAFLFSPFGRDLIIEKGRYTFSARVSYWTAGVRMLPRSPLVGNGFNSFAWLYPQYRLPGPHEARSAHNNYLQILIETGVPGFLFFAGIWILGLAAALSSARRFLGGEQRAGFKEVVVLSALIGISCFLIHSFADYDLYIPGIPMTVWLFLGLIAANTGPTHERPIHLTRQWATVCTFLLVALSVSAVFLASKTLNAHSHLAVAQSIIHQTDPPPDLRDYEDAIRELKKAMKWDHTNHNLHVILARIYSQLGQYRDALREFAVADRLQRFSPMTAHHIARTKLAEMQHQGKVDWDEVLPEFRRAVTYSPASPFHRLVYAYYLAEAGRAEESQTQLRKARQLDPSGEQALQTARLIYRDDPLVLDLERFLEQASP